jgi:8-oxo-dGTP pyrophosphatase MutT (NUDIX family)
MGGFVVHPLLASVRVSVEREMPPLDASLEAEIDRLWDAAQLGMAAGGAGRLFNGRVFSADTITEAHIGGHMTEFRRIVAQMQSPALFEALGVRPLAVCGVLRCAGGILVGRRHAGAIYQAGMWQLPPAGSVDAGAMRPDGSLDIAGQVLKELREEVGIDAAHVDVPRPLCLVEHPGSHVSDLGMAMSTSLSADEVLAAHRAAANNEYDPLLVVAEGDMEAFIVRVGADLVPPALEFLRRIGMPVLARSSGNT